MKLNRSSREPGGQASNWRPPGTGNDRRPKPEVVSSRQSIPSANKNKNKNKSETKKLVLTPPSDKVLIRNENSNSNSKSTDDVRHSRRHRHRRVWTRFKMSEIIFSFFIFISATFGLLARAQTVEGNFIFLFSFSSSFFFFSFSSKVSNEPKTRSIVFDFDFDFFSFTAVAKLFFEREKKFLKLVSKLLIKMIYKTE